MKIPPTFNFLIPIIILAACTQPKQETPPPSLHKAEIMKDTTPETFQIDLGGQSIQSDKAGHLTSGQLQQTIPFPEYFYIRTIHYFNRPDQVIVFFEITDDDVSFNQVECLDKKTLAIIWETKLQTFNLTVGQAEQEILYLGAGENAYALNLTNGAIIWQTAGLYHTYGFNSFDTISLTKDEIQLRGIYTTKGDWEIVKTAVLNKSDGTIISVE